MEHILSHRKQSRYGALSLASSESMRKLSGNVERFYLVQVKGKENKKEAGKRLIVLMLLRGSTGFPAAHTGKAAACSGPGRACAFWSRACVLESWSLGSRSACTAS